MASSSALEDEKELKELGTAVTNQSTYPHIFVLPQNSSEGPVSRQDTFTNREKIVAKGDFVKPPLFAWTSATNLMKNKGSMAILE
uniref:Uncharacterized protein n=1 Tax=Ditylenchus dipsaci TaxID=166011 RepID=A0A915DNR0_9BILA